MGPYSLRLPPTLFPPSFQSPPFRPRLPCACAVPHSPIRIRIPAVWDRHAPSRIQPFARALHHSPLRTPLPHSPICTHLAAFTPPSLLIPPFNLPASYSRFLFPYLLVTMASQPHVRYARVPTSDSEAAPDFASNASAAPPPIAGRARGSNDADIRFAGPDIHRRVPKRSVLLALFLLFLGCASLATFYLMQTGQVEAGGQQKWTCLAIAFLTLMP
ncbi:unnamed protein product, partial [Closterium sp. Naga37s-1]